VRFLVGNLVEALSSSNLPLVNPASAKAAIDTAGMNLARGGAAFLRDIGRAAPDPGHGRLVAVRDRRTVAVTPGAVARADPVPAADRAGTGGTAAHRAADH